MRRNLPLLILVVVVALVIGGYLGYTSLTKEKTPPAVGDVKRPPAKIVGDVTSSNNQKSADQVSSKTMKETNIQPVDPKAGEIIVWGEIKAVDVDKRIITIDQQMDDNSTKISPNVPVSQDAIVRTKTEVISLSRLASGDSAGIIITKAGQARAVLVNY